MPSSRRRFLGGVASLAGLNFSSGQFASGPPDHWNKKPSGLPKEHGFWDYTAPGVSGMGRYQRDDYIRLLDDMAQAGMNSLLIMVKCWTTGYRSNLPWQDQEPQNAIVASENTLLRLVLEEAAKRRIKTWLGAVVTQFEVGHYGGKPRSTFTVKLGQGSERIIGVYDPDMPQVIERSVAIYDELFALFPRAQGFLMELEHSDTPGAHREVPYNQWAAKTGHPEYKTLQVPLDPRNFNCPSWRDYVTFSRSRLLRTVESTLRDKGFEGELAMICETGNAPYVALQVVNLEYFRKLAPGWKAVTYDYWKWRNRYAMADFCMVEPKKAGLKTYYLARGIMTWPHDKQLPISLEQSWQLDVEDVQQFQPDGLWWFGSGAVGDEFTVSLSLLRKMGFADGTDARRQLLRVAEPLRP